MSVVLVYGARDQGRTGDLSLFRGALYQLSYPSMLFILSSSEYTTLVGGVLVLYPVQQGTLLPERIINLFFYIYNTIEVPCFHQTDQLLIEHFLTPGSNPGMI